MQLPATETTPLIRTEFASDAAWETLKAIIGTPNPDGFRAFVTVVDDSAFNGIHPAALKQANAPAPQHALWIIADERAMVEDGLPLLCIDTASSETLRVVAAELWGTENNLSIGNLDFAEFVGAADSDGVFRGFG
jgi:hypothetical protein